MDFLEIIRILLGIQMTGKCDMETFFANCLVWIKDHLWDTYENRLCLLSSNNFYFIILRDEHDFIFYCMNIWHESSQFPSEGRWSKTFLFNGGSKHFIGSCYRLDKATRNEVLLFYLVFFFYFFCCFYLLVLVEEFPV